jgi:hypothetical protein
MKRFDVPQDQTDEIRRQRRNNATWRQLTEDFGYPVSVLQRVCLGVTPQRLDPERRQKVSDEVCRLRAEGLTYTLIAAQVGADINAVVRACRDVETPNQRRRRELATARASVQA